MINRPPRPEPVPCQSATLEDQPAGRAGETFSAETLSFVSRREEQMSLLVGVGDGPFARQ